VLPTPGSTYYWSVECGKIISPNNNADSIVVDWCQTPGTYQIKVVERNRKGCWGDTVRTLIIVDGKLHLAVSGPTEICSGDPIWLEASGAANYYWNNGQTTNRIFVQPSDSQQTTDTVKYRVIGYSKCDNDTAYVTVKIHPRPRADFTYKPLKPMVDDTVFFHYTGKGASAWTWYFGDKNGLSGQITDPTYTFNEKGDKVVTLVARNDAGCTDTMSYNLHVGFDSRIFVPNAITPNGDGNNDYFKAVGWNLKDIHMQIYNRWGELLFESYRLDDYWDATFKGNKVMEGVYLYQIEATAKDGEKYYLHGNVTVLY
jgi:gliding motility-associated-like protein